MPIARTGPQEHCAREFGLAGDPLAGLGYGETEETGGEATERTFDAAAQDAAVMDYSPGQPRDKNGRWTSGGAGGKIGKTKYAPSPRANKRGKTVSAKTYGILRGELTRSMQELKKG